MDISVLKIKLKKTALIKLTLKEPHFLNKYSYFTLNLILKIHFY